MIITTDPRVKKAADNFRAYVDGCGENVEQEMERDLDELIAAVIDWTEKRLHSEKIRTGKT